MSRPERGRAPPGRPFSRPLSRTSSGPSSEASSHPSSRPAERAAPRASPHRTLASELLRAVRDQDFGRTPDRWHGGAAVAQFPSIDLAVAAFPANGGAPRCANVLFSREHPQGVVGEIGPGGSALRNVSFVRDVQDAKGQSIAWQAGRNWRQIPWQPVTARRTGPGPLRFVAPYPASLLKLMVAVGLGLGLDRGLFSDWPAAMEPMITRSDNDATTACVALLHRHGLVDGLNARFAALGLATLQLNDTRPDGGWRNADGSGVGHIHMTAWDTVRLLWLLDAEAPPAPWWPAPQPSSPPGPALAAAAPLLQPATRDALRAVLARQQLDQVLSSGSLRGVPGWVPGLPDAPAFAHKTGTTDNYASDAGIVRTRGTNGQPGTHYIVALLSSLGSRYAPDERCASTWRLPALGARIHALMESLP